MVNDPRRTAPLMRAVNRVVRQGDIVVDIGTGTGILAIAAARGGAGRVWAIDCDPEALCIAKKSAENAKVADRITFIEALSLDVDIPKKADVILCETVGSFAFDENILVTIADAKRRFLKRGGRIMPMHVELWGALCSCLPKIFPPADIGLVSEGDFVTRPKKLAEVNFAENFETTIRVEEKFSAVLPGTVKCAAMWHLTTWWPGCISDSSPLKPPTHWKQGIMKLPQRRMSKGEEVIFEFIIGPHPNDRKKMTERLWRFKE